MVTCWCVPTHTHIHLQALEVWMGIINVCKWIKNLCASIWQRTRSARAIKIKLNECFQAIFSHLEAICRRLPISKCNYSTQQQIYLNMHTCVSECVRLCVRETCSTLILYTTNTHSISRAFTHTQTQLTGNCALL